MRRSPGSGETASGKRMAGGSIASVPFSLRSYTRREIAPHRIRIRCNVKSVSANFEIRALSRQELSPCYHAGTLWIRDALSIQSACTPPPKSTQSATLSISEMSALPIRSSKTLFGTSRGYPIGRAGAPKSHPYATSGKAWPSSDHRPLLFQHHPRETLARQ